MLKKVLRWTAWIAGVSLLLLFALFVIVCHSALYHRFYLFPKEARAWEQIRSENIKPSLDDGWPEFKGALHAHSHFSHDSAASFEEILAALKQANCNFMFMSDHCVDGKADYSIQWHGLKDGVLFVPGYEMSQGFMPWGLPESTVFNCGDDYKEIAKKVGELGGLLFYAHSEEERVWELPELTGMEIYNIHSDLKNFDIKSCLPDFLFCLGKYPDQTLRLVFERQTEILAMWDKLNDVKKVVGISANDTHQNCGIRGYYTDKGTFLLKKTDKDEIGDYSLNFFTRFLLRAFFGPLEPGKQLFRWELDAYPRSIRFISTHILAKELTEPALLDSLRQGRVFIGFDMLADSTGFVYFAEAAENKAVMGEVMPFASGPTLKAASPEPCRFTVVRSGQPVYQVEGRELSWKPTEPGKYRVEAELSILGEWVPWVYTNPLEIK